MSTKAIAMLLNHEREVHPLALAPTKNISFKLLPIGH